MNNKPVKSNKPARGPSSTRSKSSMARSKSPIRSSQSAADKFIKSEKPTGTKFAKTDKPVKKYSGVKKDKKPKKPIRNDKTPEQNSENDEITSIQWFPGHMAKTRRLICENLKLVDLVLEMRDARLPNASRNPELDKWIETKPRIIMLNKADNADPDITRKWLEYYKSKDIPALACDCKSGAGTESFIPLLKEVLAELLQRRANKGMAGRLIRIMVVGIPNVGKSSFINRMAVTRKAKVEDRPGVTIRKQWVSLEKDIELLDMPGVLWPKFEDKLVGERLAFTGAVRDGVLDIEQLASRLLSYLAQNYKEKLLQRYKLENIEGLTGNELLSEVGKSRAMLTAGGKVNIERAAITVMDEYRSGKLGRITFEQPKL